MKNVHNFSIKGSRLNCSGYRIHQYNVDNINNVRREASRHCRNKKMEYLKVKIVERETNSNSKNITDFLGIFMTLRRVTSLEIIYESWDVNSGNYLFTTDTK